MVSLLMTHPHSCPNKARGPRWVCSPASPHRSHQEERDNDERVITEFTETQSPDRAPLRSFEDFQESQTEAEKRRPKRVATNIEGSATLVSQPTLEIQGARPVSHGALASGLPLTHG